MIDTEGTQRTILFFWRILSWAHVRTFPQMSGGLRLSTRLKMSNWNPDPKHTVYVCLWAGGWGGGLLDHFVGGGESLAYW